MSRAFFGNVMATPNMTISTNNLSAGKSAVTSAISTTASNTGGGTLTYSWQTTGNNCTVNTSSSSSTTVTGGGVAGTSNLFCNITNSANNTTYSSPSCIITWNPSTSINSVTWSIPSATTSAYNGAAQSVTFVSVDPSAATYSLATTTATNATSIASTILTGTVDYDGTFTSPNLTIGTSTITIASSGTTSKSYTGTAISMGYTVSGVYAADTGYSVSGTSATNCNNYTVTLSESSSNYTLGSPSTFGWAITPTAPANFTVPVPATPSTFGQTQTTVDFNWTAVGGCSYQVWGNGGGGYIAVAIVGVGVLSASYTAAVGVNYTFYVIALANSGQSSASRIANVYTGAAPYQSVIPYDSGWANQQPLCLTGSASGTIGFKNFPQGTYGIIISQVGVQNASCNFATSLLWGTATRTIRWNLNGTAVNFPLSTSTSAPNPYAGPTYRNTNTSGTITYTMVASGTGWSTNNSGGVSGSTWARAQWKWTGNQVVTNPAVAATVSYTP
jgi:hypothetical protein